MNKALNIIKNKRIMIIIGVLVVLSISIILFIPKGGKKLAQVQENNIYAHTDEGIIKEEEYEGIKFSNISMLTKDGQTTFTADVTNTTDSDTDRERLHVIMKDEEGNDVIKYLAYFPGGLKKGETKTVTAIAQGNFESAKTKEITE